jgi:hypothetical protein
MAELQLAIPYKTKSMRLALATMYVLFPIWSFVAPSLLGVFVNTVVFTGGSTPLASIVICGALSGIILFGLLLTALAEDDKVHVSKNGIAFPLFLTPKLSFRRNRFWNELHSAELVPGEEPSRGALILGFSGTKSIALKLRSFKSADLEELL